MPANPTVLPINWLAENYPTMLNDKDTWITDDDLLAQVLAYSTDFYHGSHTLVHLSRDQLGVTDCNQEDQGEGRRDKLLFFYLLYCGVLGDDSVTIGAVGAPCPHPHPSPP